MEVTLCINTFDKMSTFYHLCNTTYISAFIQEFGLNARLYCIVLRVLTEKYRKQWLVNLEISLNEMLTVLLRAILKTVFVHRFCFIDTHTVL